MIPGPYNITIYRGTTFSIELAPEDDDGPVPFDQTYTEGSLRIYPAGVVTMSDVDDCDILIELTVANGGLVIDGDSVIAEISSPVTSTIDWTSAKYVLDLIVGGDIPIVDRIVYGTVTVEALA